jgi:cyanophycin synthetase
MSARRITGRHFLLDGPGATVDVAADAASAVSERLRRGLDTLKWWVEPKIRAHASSVSISVPCPSDVTDAAADLLDWAALDGPDDELDDVARRAERLVEPAYRRLVEAYPGQVFDGEGLVTVGSGVHARSFRWADLPDPASLGPVGDVPMVGVTGTNGKTTTTRLLAHLAESAGLRAGRTSSTGSYVGDRMLEAGDCTGPGAARAVLRHPEVQFAALETARGGMLRRGLVRDGFGAVVLTNVTQEHLGEWGVDDLDTMARVKLVLAGGLRRGGVLVVPASTALSAPIHRALPAFRAGRPDVKVRTFGHTADADAWADATHLHVDGGRVPLSDVPLTLDGTCRHNVENVLAATLAALAVGIPAAAISLGLRTLRASVRDNPGRMNRWRLPNGALVVLDFAHTPDGLRRVAETVRAWPRRCHALLLGQAGDRSDVDLRALAIEGLGMRPERIVVKDVTGRLYGRQPGEVPAILASALRSQGVVASRILVRPDEISGVKTALAGVGPDDVVVLLIHETLAAAARVLGDLGAVEVG